MDPINQPPTQANNQDQYAPEVAQTRNSKATVFALKLCRAVFSFGGRIPRVYSYFSEKMGEQPFRQPINTRQITPSTEVLSPIKTETPDKTEATGQIKETESEESKESDLKAIRPLLKGIKSGTVQQAHVEDCSLDLLTDFGSMCLLHFLEKYQPDTYSKVIGQIRDSLNNSPFPEPDENLFRELEEQAGLSETSQDTSKKGAEGSEGQPVINDDHEEIYSTVQGTQLSRLHDYLQSISGQNWQTMTDELQFKLSLLNQENLKAFVNNDAALNNNTVAFNDIPDDLLSLARQLASPTSTDNSTSNIQPSAPGAGAADDSPKMETAQRKPVTVTTDSILSSLKSGQYPSAIAIMKDIEKLKGKVQLQRLIIELKELQSQSRLPIQPETDLKALIQKAEDLRAGHRPPTHSG